MQQNVLGPARAIRAALAFSVVGLIIIATWHLAMGGLVLIAVTRLGQPTVREPIRPGSSIPASRRCAPAVRPRGGSAR